MDVLVGAMLILVAGTVAVFLVLIAVNAVLFLKLRSGIPQEPFEAPTT